MYVYIYIYIHTYIYIYIYIYIGVRARVTAHAAGNRGPTHLTYADASADVCSRMR